jgi:transposase-like protein
VAETARELGIKKNTLTNWVYQYSRYAKLDKVVRTDEHLYDELKENARLTEERDLWTRRQRTSPEKHCSDPMDSGAECGLSGGIIVFGVICEP